MLPMTAIKPAVPTGFVVEWSDSGQVFRVQTFTKMVQGNFNNWCHWKPTDFRPIALFTSETSARDFADIMQDLRPAPMEKPPHGDN